MKRKKTLLLAVILFTATVFSNISPALGMEKFSLSMFHFNVQYVAGGLKGFPSGTDTNDTYDLDDEQVQDLIIKESFEPVLDLFLTHPSWKVTLEMQAYMLQVMLQRHTDVLEKLKTLVDNGQAEIVSFHWSDELFLAYPRRDLEASFELMDQVWKQAGFEPSPVVFCQEGQFGVGMLKFGLNHGRSIFVLPKNLFKYQHAKDYENAAPLYEKDGADLVIGARSFATSEVEVSWNFFDDGELLATGDMAPYMGKEFRKDPSALADYEQQLEELQQQGWHIASIEDYVSWAKQNGIQQQALPPMLDGTWQPPSTDSMHRWMGASGIIDMVYATERDNQVLTSNVKARHRIVAAETLVEYATNHGLAEQGQYKKELAECWSHVLLGEVSDATGINPFANEVQYGLAHSSAALQCADEILDELAPKIGGPFVAIDTLNRTVETESDSPVEIHEPTQSLFDEASGFSVEAPGRNVSVTWEKVGLADGVYRVTMDIAPGDSTHRTASVEFPLSLGGFYLTPGLVENEAQFLPFSDFDLEGRIALPVANGLIGLEPETWLVKDTSWVHLAAIFEPGSSVVRFEDQTLPADEAVTWIFWILQGDEKNALDFANRLNLHPTKHIETGLSNQRGCGCVLTGSNPGDGLIFWILFLGWASFRWWKIKISFFGKIPSSSSQPQSL